MNYIEKQSISIYHDPSLPVPPKKKYTYIFQLKMPTPLLNTPSTPSTTAPTPSPPQQARTNTNTHIQTTFYSKSLTSEKAPKPCFQVNNYLLNFTTQMPCLHLQSMFNWAMSMLVLFYSSGLLILVIDYPQGLTKHIAKPFSTSYHWLTSHTSIGYTSEANILSYHSTKQWLNLRTGRRH